MKKKILCVISARGGSIGLKNKNIKKFNGKPLISWTIHQALNSKYINKVYISTDSKKISKVSRKFGAHIPFLRNGKISKKNSSKFLAWKDALKQIESINNQKYDYYLDLDCTNPLRSSNDINNFCKTFLTKKKNFDGMFTVAKARKNPYFNILEKYKNNFIVSKLKKKWPASRHLSPAVYDQVASMYIFNTNFIRQKNSMYEGKITGYLLKDYQNFDIDSDLDFFIIDKLFKKYYLRK